MRFLLLFFILNCYLFSNELTLKSSIITYYDKIPISLFFVEENRYTNLFFNVKDSIYLNNTEVSKILLSYNIKNFVVYGKGIEIKKINKLSQKDDIFKIINDNGYKIDGINKNININGNFLIDNVSLKNNDDRIDVFISYYDLNGIEGVLKNVAYSFKKSNIIDSNKHTGHIDENKEKTNTLFLRILGNNDGELIFRKNNLMIKSKVKILAKVSEKEWVLQNTTSGQRFSVKNVERY